MLNHDMLSVSSILHSHSELLRDAPTQRKQKGARVIARATCFNSFALEEAELETFSVLDEQCSHEYTHGQCEKVNH